MAGLWYAVRRDCRCALGNRRRYVPVEVCVVSLAPESLPQGAVSTMAAITFFPDDRTIEVDAGDTILHAARAAGVQVDAPCAERGRCGKCRVRVLSGEVSPPSAEEQALLKADELARGMRLSCLTRAFGHVVVEVPETSRNLAQRKPRRSCAAR